MSYIEDLIPAASILAFFLHSNFMKDSSLIGGFFNTI